MNLNFFLPLLFQHKFDSELEIPIKIESTVKCNSFTLGKLRWTEYAFPHLIWRRCPENFRLNYVCISKEIGLIAMNNSDGKNGAWSFNAKICSIMLIPRTLIPIFSERVIRFQRNCITTIPSRWTKLGQIIIFSLKMIFEDSEIQNLNWNKVEP